MKVRFLEEYFVVAIHESSIAKYGGTRGLRDQGLLASAIAQPSAMCDGEYLHADLFEMAAAYLFHIAQNQPFLDGNKRTAVASAIVFLTVNGVDIHNDEEGLVAITLAIATRDADKSDVAEFLRSIELKDE